MQGEQKFFLNTFGADDVIDMIKEGVMIGRPAKRRPRADEFTKREMPW